MSDQEIIDAAGPVDLKEITALALQAVALEREIEELTTRVEERRVLLSELRNNKLPDAMSSVGMSRFTLEDGSEIRISNYVNGSLPKDPEKRTRAVAVLEGAGGSDLLKTTVSVAFGKTEHNAALALLDDLKKQDYDAQIETTVHSSTLQAFVREKVAEGSTLDYEALGVFVGRIAKINPA